MSEHVNCATGRDLLRKWLGERSKQDFAAIIGVSRVYLYQMLGGFGRPSLEVAARIEIATGGAVPCVSWVDEAAVAARSPQDAPVS